jgi:2-oxoacid:acceptor oxidoreductase delta subunit (pyruvate/2-ketoisovalerate family)
MGISIRSPHDVPDGTPMAVSLRSTSELVTGSWRTFRPTYVTRPSPCNLDCPAGTDVRGFLAAASRGEALDAWRIILERNPLPGVCGRVCYHPCETRCNRAILDGRVAIHAVERAIADEALRLAPPHEAIDVRDTTAALLAVVGSGPAGLSCAYHAARRGHQVVVFESMPEPGGMLRYGIPEYRLPRPVLEGELDLLRALGVRFETGARLGASLPWSSLDPFDAVFVAVGTQRSRAAAVPGEDFAGVRPALDLLRDVNAGNLGTIDGTVIVIGGGNTALDAARVVLRQGGKATIVYRRTREEMPAHPDEISQAEAEGVEFIFQAAPLCFDGLAGQVTGAQFQRTRPGPPDASGRRSPEPIPGDTFTLPCSLVLTAIGEELEREAFASAMEVARGRLKADRWGRTSQATLFAGGDAATGAGTVVDAIGSGRRAAEAIDAWLSGAELADLPTDAAQRVGIDDVNVFYFPVTPRSRPPALDRVEAVSSFDEVIGSLSWEQAMVEADRCFTCGECTYCDTCLVFCPDMAVARAPEGGYTIDYAHCKGCGICVHECPRGAITLVPEEAR